MRIIAAAFVLLITATTAHAADARATYPASAPACQYIVIDGTESAGSLEWTPLDADVETWLAPHRRKLLINCPTPRACRILLIARDQTGAADHQIITIDVTGDAPSPPTPRPRPEPAPTPPTPTPAPRPSFGLTPRVTTEAQRVKSSALVDEARQIAALAEQIAQDIDAGTLRATDPAAIGTAIDAAVARLPRAVQIRWLPGFGRWWTRELQTLYTTGKLTTAADWSQALKETANGLRAVKP